MITKSTSRQRAISDYNFIKKSQAQVILHLQEARLFINVARLGTMYVSSRLSLGKQEFLSLPSDIGGLHPKWNQFFSFTLGNERKLTISTFDKSLFFGETEIGRCLIDLAEVIHGRLSSWWKLLNSNGLVVGEVLVNFEFTQSTPRHTPTSSWDSKMPTPESPVCVPRGHFKHLTLAATRTPDLKITHCSTEPDEISDLETLKEDLIRENERIRNQENSFRVIFEKLKQETQAVKREKDELKTRKEELRMKEESIIQQKVDMEEERVALDNEKKFVWNLRQSLDQEFLYLKNEQLRVRVKKIYKKKIKEILERNQLRMQKQIELRVNIEEFN